MFSIFSFTASPYKQPALPTSEPDKTYKDRGVVARHGWMQNGHAHFYRL